MTELRRITHVRHGCSRVSALFFFRVVLPKERIVKLGSAFDRLRFYYVFIIKVGVRKARSFFFESCVCVCVCV